MVSKSLDKMSTKELKKDANTYYSLVYNEECYGVRDLVILNEICKELARRGYQIEEHVELVFKKE